MPEAVEMRLAVPAELGPEAEVLEDLRQRVAAAVASIAEERQRMGKRILGRRAVLRQPWWEQPQSFEPRRNLRPRVAARSKWARIEALLRNRVFVRDYAAARAAWLDGVAVIFPPGTYWLRRFANVPVAAL
jgi:hypothetical protein